MEQTSKNRFAAPLATRTTAQLRVIASALRNRATTGRLPEPDLSREIARIERLIAERHYAGATPRPGQRRTSVLV